MDVWIWTTAGLVAVVSIAAFIVLKRLLWSNDALEWTCKYSDSGKCGDLDCGFGNNCQNRKTRQIGY
jgi:hypothetical protein